MGWVVILGGLAIVSAISIALHRSERIAATKRQKELLNFARQNGYSFHPIHSEPGGAAAILGSLVDPPHTRGELAFLRVFSGWMPFSRSARQSVNNLLVKREQERDWYLFDLTCVVSTGKNTVTERYGIVAVRIPYTLPAIALFRDSLSHRVRELFVQNEIEFESAEFNERYIVFCPDKKDAFDLIHPEAIDWIMSMPIMDWQMSGPYLLVYREGYCTVAQAERMKVAVGGFLDRLPSYVRQDRHFNPAWTSPTDQTGLDDIGF